MDRTRTKPRQRAILKLVCVWLLACSWAGCASKGGARPWESLLPSRLFKGQEQGAEEVSPDGAGGRQGAGAEATASAAPPASPSPWASEGDEGGSVFGRQASPSAQSWPFLEELEASWQEALLRQPLLASREGGQPPMDRFIRFYKEDAGPHFHRSLAKSTRYLPMMRQIFREEGLPEDLAYLALIESGFNPWAASRNQCVGLWQFTEGTGRKYGLRIDGWVDERRDPERSTRAAARYLRDLYSAFRSWDLAIAAYNAGEGNISNYVARRNAASYWELYAYPDLRPATRDFVPKFMAALKLARDPEGHGFIGIPYEEAWRFDRIKISDHMDLETIARLAGCSEQEIRTLNPHIKGRSAPPGLAGMELRVPEGKGEALQALLAQKGPMVQRSAAAKEWQAEPSDIRVHRVKPGDTLEEIARQYGTSVDAIRKLNLLSSPTRLRVGSQLSIPLPQGGGQKGVQHSRKGDEVAAGQGSDSGTEKETKRTARDRSYQVKRGDTLSSISRRYGVSVSDLSRWNRLKGAILQPGMVLTIRD